FVDSEDAAHAAVTVLPGAPDAAKGRPMHQEQWFVKAKSGAFAHEVAHRLGMVHKHQHQHEDDRELLKSVDGLSSGASGGGADNGGDGHGGAGHYVLTEQALRDIALVAQAYVAPGGAHTPAPPP